MNTFNSNIKFVRFLSLAFAAIMTGSMSCHPFSAMAASYSGQLDTVTNTGITGWARDAATPDNPVGVSISITPENSTEPVRETTLIASEYREHQTYPSRSAGYCGFRWDVDWSGLDNGNYLVSVCIGTSRAKKTLTYTNTLGKTAVSETNSDILAGGPAGDSCRSLGVFKTTAYCPCQACSEGWGRNTSTGALASAGHTIAVDPRVIPYGSKVMIGGIVYTAEDRGGGVKGNHIDVFYDTHAETKQHGVRYQEAFIIQ